MKKYDSYKDSGIEWVGDVPSHWTTHRIDWITNIVRGNTGFLKDELQEVGEYVALQYGKTYKVDIIEETFNYYVNSEFFKESQIVSKGDTILISTSETIEDLGHTCFYNNSNIGLLGGEQILLTPNRNVLYEKFLYHYASQFGAVLKKYAKGLKVFRFNTNDLKHIFISIPSIEEQNQIAKYLDHKTTKIDNLIAKKESLIQLLEEERVSVITQAVTKGLDPNVPMKDSGIEWLGEIPEHWEVKKLAFEFQTKNTKRIPLSAEERGCMEVREYDYYGASGVIDKVENYLFDEDLILVGEDGANLLTRSKRLAFIASGKYWVNNHAHIIKPTSGNINYLCELLELIDYTIYITGSAQPKLTQEALMSIKIPVPPAKEQNSIFNFLEYKLQKIDKTIKSAQQEIKLLKEYKTSLISEVVTGKVDVRNEKLN